MSEAKEKGNKHFVQGRFTEAISEYTRSINVFSQVSVPPTSLSVVHCNRAAALIQLGRYAEALKDAETCLQLDNTSLKVLK